MSKGFKNTLLVLAVIVVIIVRACYPQVFDLTFYIGCLVMAAVEGLYLFLNRNELEETDRVNELFYLAGIGIVIACKIFVF